MRYLKIFDYKIISLGSELSRSEVFEFVFFIDPTK